MRARNGTLLAIGGAALVLYLLSRREAARVTGDASASGGILDEISAQAKALMTSASGIIRNIVSSTLALVRAEEGFSAKPYPDAGGYSVGYGHYLGTTTQGIKTITKAQAEKWLREDLLKAANAIRKHVKVPITQNQFDALSSWLYNVGAGSLSTSTLLKKLNAGDYAGAADQLRRWIYSQGKVHPELQARRERERALFLTPDRTLQA